MSFKQKVYDVVSQIPRGKTLSYRQVAQRAGNKNAYRAVGNIMNKNRNPRVPCHRVIKSDGGLGGFNGGPRKKLELLKKEGYVYKKGADGTPA